MENLPDTPNKEDKYNKPIYDARQVYYNRIVIPLMEGITLSFIKKDLPNCILLIEALFDATSPFLKDKDKVLAEINDCYDTYNEYDKFGDTKNQTTASIVFERQLHKLARVLYESAKDMLLPVSSETIEEFNWDDFKRQSDLA